MQKPSRTIKNKTHQESTTILYIHVVDIGSLAGCSELGTKCGSWKPVPPRRLVSSGGLFGLCLGHLHKLLAHFHLRSAFSQSRLRSTSAFSPFRCGTSWPAHSWRRWAGVSWEAPVVLSSRDEDPWRVFHLKSPGNKAYLSQRICQIWSNMIKCCSSIINVKQSKKWASNASIESTSSGCFANALGDETGEARLGLHAAGVGIPRLSHHVFLPQLRVMYLWNVSSMIFAYILHANIYIYIMSLPVWSNIDPICMYWYVLYVLIFYCKMFFVIFMSIS